MSDAPTTDPQDRLITQREYAARCRVDPTTVARWARLGIGPRAIRLSAQTVRFRESEVEQFITDRSGGAA